MSQRVFVRNLGGTPIVVDVPTGASGAWINVKDHGALGDGATDDTAAITDAIAAMPTDGGVLEFPPGEYRFTSLTFNKAGIYRGAGMGTGVAGQIPTELVTTTAGGGITVTASGVELRDFGVTSTIAVGSRTAAGIKLTTAANALRISHVASVGHLYGFWIQQGVVALITSWSFSNASHGFYFDGNLGTGMGEYTVEDCLSFNNGGSGFQLYGSIAGAWFRRPIATTNAVGIKIETVGGGTPADVYIEGPEMSGTGIGIDISSATNCLNVTISGGLIESGAAAGISVGNDVFYVNILGVQIQGYATGILLNGDGGTVSGVSLNLNGTDLELGATSNGYHLGQIISSEIAGQESTIGLKITGAAQKFSAAGVDFSRATTPLTGTIPAGSQIIASPGLSNRLLTSLSLEGSSSGLVGVATQAAAGTYNFNLPITAGSTGEVLTSGGGGASPMTWSTAGSGAAPVAAQYVTMALDGSLSAERVLVGGSGLTLTDGGANGNATLNVGAGTGITVNANDVALTVPVTVANGGTGQTTEAEAIGELIQALSADAAPDNAADYIATYDASADTGKKVLLSTVVREKLTAARTYYVRTDGNDSNTGLTNSAGGAFLTLQGAWNAIVFSIDFGGQTVTIQVEDGTYTAGMSISAWTGGGTAVIQGDTTTPTNCKLNVNGGICFSVDTGTPLPGRVTIQGFKIGDSNTPSYGIKHLGIGAIVMNSMDFGACSTVHITADGSGALVNCNGDYTISGGAVIHWQAVNLAQIAAASGSTITLTGTPAFSGQFAQASDISLLYVSGLTFSGSATGTRYFVNLNAVIQTGGGGANYFPGNAAGATATGGQYA